MDSYLFASQTFDFEFDFNRQANNIRDQIQLLTNDRLRESITLSSYTVAMFDNDMKYLATSQSWLSDHVRKMDSVIGRSHYDVFPEMPEPWREIHRRCLSGAIEKSDVDEFVRTNGASDFLRWEIWPWHHQDSGQIGGIIILAEDMTMKTRAEEAIKQSGVWLLHLTDALPVLIAYLDAGQKYRFANALYEKWFGVSGSNILGKHLKTIVGEGAYSKISPHMEEALRGIKVHFETILPQCGVGLRYVEINFVPDIHKSGVIQGIFVLIKDVTDRKKAEDRIAFLSEASSILSETLDYNETLTRLVQVATGRYSAWCSVVMIGDGGDHQLPVTNVVGFRSLIVKRHLDVAAPQGNCILARVLRTGKSEIIVDVNSELQAQKNLDQQIIDRMNGEVLKSGMIVPILSRGQILGAMTFASELTAMTFDLMDVNMAEDLARRTATAVENSLLYRKVQNSVKTRDQFLATLSHELRTPLNVILGWVNMLRYEELDEVTFNQALDTLEKNGKIQKELIDDLLDVSRIINGKVSLTLRPVDFKCIVESQEMAWSLRARSKGVDLQVEVGSEPILVLGDMRRLNQILSNLISNSIKFTPNSGKINVKLSKTDQSVVLSVMDTGQGVEPTFLPHIFEPLIQEDMATTRNHGGLGLGLSITRHIIEQHKGEIRAFSAGRGQGAEFTVNH
jgi:PAS domain S-box-containing protein